MDLSCSSTRCFAHRIVFGQDVGKGGETCRIAGVSLRLPPRIREALEMISDGSQVLNMTTHYAHC